MLRLRNHLSCVGWGVKLYSLTHSQTMFIHLQLCSLLPPPSSCSYTSILLSTTPYTDLFSMYCFVVLSSTAMWHRLNYMCLTSSAVIASCQSVAKPSPHFPSSYLLTGQLADKPTRGQCSRGLDNSRTGQLADSEFLEIIKLLYFICTLNLTLTLTLTLSNIGSV